MPYAHCARDAFGAQTYAHTNATKEIIKKLLSNIKEEFYNFKETEDLSYSAGYAIFDEELDKNINKTIRRADELMYKFKRQNN